MAEGCLGVVIRRLSIRPACRSGWTLRVPAEEGLTTQPSNGLNREPQLGPAGQRIEKRSLNSSLCGRITLLRQSDPLLG